MLRIIQNNSPASAQQYYSSADYYTNEQELVGRWGGIAADQLGLSGDVKQEEFKALTENLHPQTGEQLRFETAQIERSATISTSMLRNLFHWCKL